MLSLACAGIVAQGASQLQHDVAEGVALRTIEVYGQNEQGIQPLTTDKIRAIRSLPNIAAVEPQLQASFDFKQQGLGAALLTATTPQPSSLPPIVTSTRTNLFPLRDGEAVLPAESQGVDFHQILGQTLNIDFTQKVAEGVGQPALDKIRVVALYDPNYQQDGPAAAYVDPALVLRWAAARAGLPQNNYLDVMGYNQANVIVDSSEHVSSVLQQLHQDGFYATSLAQRLTQLPGALRLFSSAVRLLIGLILLFSLAAGFALSSLFVRQRTREIGLLKAVGFRQRRILVLFLSELSIAGLLADAAGVILGNGLSAVLGAVLSGRSWLGLHFQGLALPNVWWSVLLLFAPAAAMVLGGYFPTRRACKIPPDEALREW